MGAKNVEKRRSDAFRIVKSSEHTSPFGGSSAASMVSTSAAC
jgi:hypothetical protein